MKMDFDNIFVFSTNIKTEKEKQTIASLLDNNPAIIKWNIDLKDIDSVLRIESNQISPLEIIGIVSKQDFKCSELEE